jgi:hypothetical protein
MLSNSTLFVGIMHVIVIVTATETIIAIMRVLGYVLVP